MERLTRLNTNLALLKMHQAKADAAAARTLDVEVRGCGVGRKLVTFPAS